MTRRAEIRNPKFETRNKFQEKRMGKTEEQGVSVVFRRLLHFEFVSSFEFRVSSFSRRSTSGPFLPKTIRGRRPQKMRITLFVPCFIDSLYPNVAISMVQVLERLGHEIDYPENQTCCGQPPFNSGYWDEARVVAAKQLEAFRDAEVLVSGSGSCGAMIKVFYPELFAGTPQEPAAKALASKTYEFSER